MKSKRPYVLGRKTRVEMNDIRRRAMVTKARRILERADQSFVGDATRHAALVELVDELKVCMGMRTA